MNEGAAESETHYNLASAMIKSIRGSDVEASLHYLARLIAAGEEPRFIARRLSILASEDIGNANPNALTLASSVFSLTEKIGMPESRIMLAQLAIYLACSPKSNIAIIQKCPMPFTTPAAQKGIQAICTPQIKTFGQMPNKPTSRPSMSTIPNLNFGHTPSAPASHRVSRARGAPAYRHCAIP